MNTTNHTFTPPTLSEQIDEYQVLSEKMTWLSALFSAADQFIESGHAHRARELSGLGQYIAHRWASDESELAQKLEKMEKGQAQ